MDDRHGPASVDIADDEFDVNDDYDYLDYGCRNDRRTVLGR